MLLVLPGILLASIAGMLGVRRERPSPLQTALVMRGTFVDFLPLRGEIRPVHSVVLTAPSSGADLQIVELAKNGATVTAGDVIVEFDPTAQQRTLEQKQSELKQAESEIDKSEAEQRRRVQAAQTDLEQARSAVVRARLDLGKREIVSRVDAEKLALALSDAEQLVIESEQKVEGERVAAAADVASARQRRDKALYDVRETERIIGSLTMRAPAAGSISLLPNYRAGNPFSRAAPEFKRGDRAWVGAPIVELPDLRLVQMTCRIDEADRGRVQTEASARVRVDAVPDRELQGTIHDIAVVAKPDFTLFPPIRNFDMTIALSETDPRLRSGMSASARIELDRLTGVLLVPAAAVFQRGAATIVYVASHGTLEPRPVTLLRRGRDQVAIASGVLEGDHVSLKEPEMEGGTR
jgi:HlyD family secretion protein